MDAKLGLLLSLCLFAACAPRESADRAVIIRTAVDSADLACRLYATDMAIPRDATVTAFCESRCRQ